MDKEQKKNNSVNLSKPQFYIGVVFLLQYFSFPSQIVTLSDLLMEARNLFMHILLMSTNPQIAVTKEK